MNTSKNFNHHAYTARRSLRNAGAVFGLGFLEGVSEEDVLAIAKLQTKQGLIGRPSHVRDNVNDEATIGRFG
jgi:CxxC motif-containing protein (DUF1111 family)